MNFISGLDIAEPRQFCTGIYFHDQNLIMIITLITGSSIIMCKGEDSGFCWSSDAHHTIALSVPITQHTVIV